MVDYFTLFWAASAIAVINMVWFNSTAFEEYTEMLYADKFFNVKSFKTAQKKDFTLTYHNYLLIKHSSFFIRLITCKLCFTIWLSILACLNICFINLKFLIILSYTIYGGVIRVNEH